MTESKVKCYLEIDGKRIACSTDYSEYMGKMGKPIPLLPEEAEFINQYMHEGEIPVLEFTIPGLRKKKWRRKNSKRHKLRKSKLMRKFHKGAARITSGKLSLKIEGAGCRLGSLNNLDKYERFILAQGNRELRAARMILTGVERTKLCQRANWRVKLEIIVRPLVQRETLAREALELPKDGLVKADDNFAGGFQRVYKFDNGYGASVVWHTFSHGNEIGLWEVGFLEWNGDESSMKYYEPFGGSTSPGLPMGVVKKALEEIANL